MANRSRRLPGGRVRKPLAQRARPTTEAPDPEIPDSGLEPARVETKLAPTLPAPAPRPGTAPVRPAAVAASTRPAQPAAEPKRVGVGARARAGVTSPRRSTSLMELAATNYTHIRGDLTRIGMLAVLMLAIIVGLSFVLK